jgi:hypothetical protein
MHETPNSAVEDGVAVFTRPGSVPAAALTGDAATILLTGWAQAAEPADRVASATYVRLPKPRKIVERPPASRLRADVLPRTATLESKVGLLPSAPSRVLI